MKPLITLLISSLFILSSCLSHAASTPPQASLSVDTFTQLPHTLDVKISPDGEHIAAAIMHEGRYVLGILRSSDLKILTVSKVRGENVKVSEVYWANNSRVLYRTVINARHDKTPRHSSNLYGINIDGNKHKVLLGYQANRVGESTKGELGSFQIIDLMPNDPKHIIVAYYPWKLGASYYLTSTEAKPKIYRVNVNTTQLKQLTRLPTPLAHAITDNNHQVRISYTMDANYGAAIHHKAPNQNKWQELNFKGLPNAIRIEPISFAADNNQLYVKVHHNQGPQSLYLYNLTTHQAEKVFQHNVVDIHQLVKGSNNDEIVALSTEHGRPQYHIFNHQDPISQIHKQLLQTLKGYNIEIVSWSKNNQKAIVFVYADYEPGHYYLYDHKTRDLTYVLSAQEELDATIMASKNPIEIQSKSNQPIHGYLTLPSGKSKSLPTVIFANSNDKENKTSWSFDWQSQLLAHKGYAVLQLNTHANKALSTQGGLTDAAEHLIAKGIADKNRICLFAQGFDDYNKFLDLVKEQSLFRCAVSSMAFYQHTKVFGRHYYDISINNFNYLAPITAPSEYEQFVNNATNSNSQLPSFKVKNISTPLFFIHGATDRRHPVEQLNALELQLKSNNINYQKLILKNEGSGFYDEQNRQQIYSEILDFLDVNIGG